MAPSQIESIVKLNIQAQALGIALAPNGSAEEQGQAVVEAVVALERGARHDGQPSLRHVGRGLDLRGPHPGRPLRSSRHRLMTTPGARLLDLVAVMDRLRSPGGCPWDARQTHASLVEYLIEEAYETVETIEESDRDGLREELGDLLLQVVFHARIAAEDPDDPWTIDDVADGIVAKLVARHPHVFGAATAETAEEVEANWHALKAKEKGRESVTDGIPAALPALVHAGKVLSRSAALGDRLPGAARGRERPRPPWPTVDGRGGVRRPARRPRRRGPGPRVRRRDRASAIASRRRIAAIRERRGPRVSVTDDFRALAERIVDDLLEADPVSATWLGDHRFDDRLPDLSGDGVAAQLRLIDDHITALDAVDDVELDVTDAVDLEILRARLLRSRFELADIRRQEWDPMVWNPGHRAAPAAVPGVRARCGSGGVAEAPHRGDPRRAGRCARPAGGDVGHPRRDGDRPVRRDPAACSTATPVPLAGADALVDQVVAHVDDFVAWLRDRLPDATRSPRLGERLYAGALWHAHGRRRHARRADAGRAGAPRADRRRSCTRRLASTWARGAEAEATTSSARPSPRSLPVRASTTPRSCP